jgi:hypothetical protein
MCRRSCLIILVVVGCLPSSPATTLASHFWKAKETVDREQGRNKAPKLGQILRSLLEDLDRVSNVSEEISDTDVRERMWEAVEKAFINPRRGYVLPKEFGMFTQRGNARVREALRLFIQRASLWAGRNRVSSPKARLAAFQDPEVASRKGSHYDDFFGDS